MSESSSRRSGGIGCGGLVIILLIGLKLTHYIDWSWWWVLAPIWISSAVVGAMVHFCLGLAVITGDSVATAFPKELRMVAENLKKATDKMNPDNRQ